MTCRVCGAALPENAEGCPRCGARLASQPTELKRPAISAPGAPPRGMARREVKPVSMGKYFLWWTIALFSNVEIVCMILSLVFVFDSDDRNRANFFRAVLLFKLLFLLVGMIAVAVLALCGFPFNDLLNRIGPRALWDLLQEVF